ncbi:hypothetical protein EBB07_31155 [Paenibacillaceae bacterium]|nr:hypothetical protein EBB07_31155 [Paenibacillaceae bacterium]
MKRKKRNFIGIIFLIFLLLIFTCPTELDYVKWLDQKHQLTCINDGFNIDCKKMINGKYEPISKFSRYTMHGVIYKTIRDRYKDIDGNTIEIKSIGIMKLYIEIS